MMSKRKNEGAAANAAAAAGKYPPRLEIGMGPNGCLYKVSSLEELAEILQNYARVHLLGEIAVFTQYRDHIAMIEYDGEPVE
jgi:hypothetical protein